MNGFCRLKGTMLCRPWSIVVCKTMTFYVSWLVSQLTYCRHSAAWAYAYAWTTSSPKLQVLETCSFFLMKAYLLRMKNCSRHSDPFVRLFAITKNVKILTHFHSFYSVEIYNKSVFRLDDWRLLYIYMTSVVDASLQPTHPVYAVFCFKSSVTMIF